MKSILMTMTIGLAVPVVGCAVNRTDLVRSGFVTLKPQLTKPLIRAPDIYEHEGSLVVDGQLDDSAVAHGGHVDVRVVAPDGVVVYDAQVNYRRHAAGTSAGSGRRGRLQRQRAQDHYHYTVRFPGLPPEGSVVQVVFDPRPHEAE